MKKKSKKAATRRSVKKKPEAEKLPRIGTSRKVGPPKIAARQRRREDPVLTIAASLKSIREDKGISVAKLARKLNIAPATLINFEERGHGIAISKVAAIAAALDCEVKIQPVKAKKKR